MTESAETSSNPTPDAATKAGDGAASGGGTAIAPSKEAAIVPPQGTQIADFARYERDLFGLYTRFRYNEQVCRRLTRKAMSLERWVRRSVVITLGVSLFSGIIPGMNQATLNWVWGSLTTAATLLTVYSLFEGSGEKQFRWFQQAMRFRSSANQVEFFSNQVRRGKITEDELAQTWHGFRQELDTLLDSAGPSFLEFEEEHNSELTEEVEAVLRREKRAL